jgi:alcohol dehydrogenase
VTATEALARRLEELAEAGGLRNSLRAGGVSESDLTELASDAAGQWTGTFNPRPFDKQGAIEIYRCAY